MRGMEGGGKGDDGGTWEGREWRGGKRHRLEMLVGVN
jgi:hypothetical protein